MLLKFLLSAPLFGSLAGAITCVAELGTSISPIDCLFAKAILYTKLANYQPSIVSLVSTPRIFSLDSAGDPRYRMPQGASFGSCGLGIDIAPTPRATSSWANLFAQVNSLILGCPNNHARPGLGGTTRIGAFGIMIVNPGQGMRNVWGTCMAPNPVRSTPLPLLLELSGRYRGFEAIAPRFPPPITTILPAPPAPFPGGFTIIEPNWPQFRVGGQWVCNTDVWSPMAMANALLTTPPRPVWILLSAVRASQEDLTPFSRNFPRTMGAAWFRVQNGNSIRVRGAWGARGSIWHPLTGDLTSVHQLVVNYAWVLVELGDANQAGGMTLPALGQQQRMAAANQAQAGSLQGPQRAGTVGDAQQPAGIVEGDVDNDNVSLSTISNDVNESNPDDLLTEFGYGFDDQGQVASSMGNQTLAMGRSAAGPSRLDTGLFVPPANTLNSSTAMGSSQPTSSSQYIAAPGLGEAPDDDDDDDARPFKRPRPNP